MSLKLQQQLQSKQILNNIYQSLIIAAGAAITQSGSSQSISPSPSST
jgi:hypothetical protein